MSCLQVHNLPTGKFSRKVFIIQLFASYIFAGKCSTGSYVKLENAIKSLIGCKTEKSFFFSFKAVKN